VSVFKRVTDWLSQAGSSVYPAVLEDQFDLFRGDQRSRCIMHSDIFCSRVEMIQTGADGILAMFPPRNDRLSLFEFFIADDLFYFSQSIFARDDNDPADAPSALK